VIRVQFQRCLAVGPLDLLLCGGRQGRAGEQIGKDNSNEHWREQ
jgi:hypothetical protein